MNMVEQVTDYVKNYDEEVGKAIELELGRQRRNLELIASENIISPAVMMAMATVPANKYAEGYPGKRYYGGCENVDIIENLAIERLKELFGCDHACVQPHSGANANNAVYQALIKPGDTVMGLNLAHGGHLTHGSPVNQSGILYNFVPYNINDDGVLDYDEIRKLAHECKPKMIVAGASAYPREIRFDIFADIAKEVGAYLFVDMAHIAGLVAAGLHQNPVPYADVVTTTTHKTLRGPRGGVIMCKEEHAKAILRIGKKILDEKPDERLVKECTSYMASAAETARDWDMALEMYTDMLEWEEESKKEDIYQKLVKIQGEKGLKDQALEICRKGAEELKDSKQLRTLYMRMQCSDSDISREICAQTVKEYLNQIPEIKEETEFQKLAQEYGIVMEGENVWVGR